MFGLNVNQIVEGHIKELKKDNEQLYQKRIAICKKCPLFSNGIMGYVCDSKKCVDINKQDVVKDLPNKGDICGCGCRLSAKTRSESAKCVLNKW